MNGGSMDSFFYQPLLEIMTKRCMRSRNYQPELNQEK